MPTFSSGKKRVLEYMNVLLEIENQINESLEAFNDIKVKHQQRRATDDELKEAKHLLELNFDWTTIQLYRGFEILLEHLLVAELQRDSTNPDTFEKFQEDVRDYLRNQFRTGFFTIGGDIESILTRFLQPRSYLLQELLNPEVHRILNDLRRLRNFAAHGDTVSRGRVLEIWNNHLERDRRNNISSTGSFMRSQAPPGGSALRKEPTYIQSWLSNNQNPGSRMEIFWTLTKDLIDQLHGRAPGRSR